MKGEILINFFVGRLIKVFLFCVDFYCVSKGRNYIVKNLRYLG